ncbi:lyase family protein [Oceanicaulis sp. LC35]|uniref:lyase family protein n=1 Tax=Oceanicaulis sp. LC35 TaxID=3349635 RepID=UPI003F84F5FF
MKTPASLLLPLILIACSGPEADPAPTPEPADQAAALPAESAHAPAPAFTPQSPVLSPNREIEAIFSNAALNAQVLRLEAALARAQAHEGVIPQSAADAITRAAIPENTPQDAIDAEYAVVRHRMVALLNVLRHSLDEESADYLHYGATTVDLYDSAAMLQMRDAVFALIEDLRVIELQLIELADHYKATPMIGRTLGQHALPLTYGKSVSGYIGENRRHIDRLSDLLDRIDRSIIMKGAVGSYLGLGPEGQRVEARMAQELGLPAPYPDDWHASRDVFAEFALVQSMMAHTYARLGQEVFLLQMTDIGAVVEERPGGAVGSSTMPHKVNPSLSEALIQHGRTIPRLAEIVQDDMVNFFERDNTSRPNDAVADIALATEDMLGDASRLISRLRVNEARMAQSLELSQGWILTQRIVFAIQDDLGREGAEHRLRDLASEASETGASLREAIESDPALLALFEPGELDALLDPRTYLGLDVELTESVIAQARAARETDPVRTETP